MAEFFFQRSDFFGIALTVAAFMVGAMCQKKLKLAIFNPILIGAALVMVVLWVLKIPVGQYQAACKKLTFLLTPVSLISALRPIADCNTSLTAR